MKTKSWEMFDKLKKTLGSYGGGAIRWKDVAYMEHIKPSMPTMYHERIYLEDGKLFQVMVMIIERRGERVK